MFSKNNLVPALLKQKNEQQEKFSCISLFCSKVKSILMGKENVILTCGDDVLLTWQDVEDGYIYVSGKGKVKLSELTLPSGKNALEESLERHYKWHLYHDEFIWKMVMSFNTFKIRESIENNQFEFIQQKKTN